jgi:hypothetical protein
VIPSVQRRRHGGILQREAPLLCLIVGRFVESRF